MEEDCLRGQYREFDAASHAERMKTAGASSCFGNDSTSGESLESGGQ